MQPTVQPTPLFENDAVLTPVSIVQLSRHQFVVHAHGREFSFTRLSDAQRFIGGIPLII